jgi:hypothetical protein
MGVFVNHLLVSITYHLEVPEFFIVFRAQFTKHNLLPFLRHAYIIQQEVGYEFLSAERKESGGLCCCSWTSEPIYIFRLWTCVGLASVVKVQATPSIKLLSTQVNVYSRKDEENVTWKPSGVKMNKGCVTLWPCHIH